MISNKVIYRYFKVSFNLPYVDLTKDTGVFTIRNNVTLVLLSAWYVLVCLLFGWWGGSILKPFRNIKRTLHDLNVNLNGGIDFTKEMNDDAYDDETNFVWNNLTRESRSRIEKSTLEFILVLHNNF
ncbi:MAG: hypothetical protein ACI9JN_001509, partial [Bacteroidia bacterium]